MMRTVFGHIIRFIFFVLLQALVVNNLNLAEGWVLPFIYPFALMMMPVTSPQWLLMVLGFAMGFAMDSFMATWGMHTSAAVLVGFLQPYVLQLIAPREGYDVYLRPTVQDMGLPWYLTFAALLMVPFHLWLGLLEVFSLKALLEVLGRTALSTLAALVLMILGQYLMFTSKAPSS